jgi:hypothetical protein
MLLVNFCKIISFEFRSVCCTIKIKESFPIS